MSTSFTRTRTQIAQLVVGKINQVIPTAVISTDMESVYEAIDLRLKDIHSLGIFWRKVTSVPVTFSLGAGIISASAGAGDILFPLSMTFTNGTNDDPVKIVGPREYAQIEDKARQGNPEKALWKGGSEFFLYPIPTADGTAKLLYEKIADDTSAGAAVDVDVSMIRSLADLVKYDLADYFGVPEQKIVRWEREAVKAERRIKYLSAPRIDYAPVAVDDYDTPYRRETDYGR